MIAAVVLDVDDTLCMTESACFELENTVLRHMGRASMSRELHQSTWGMPLLDAMSVRSPGIDVTAFSRAYQPLLEQSISEGVLDQVPQHTCDVLDALIDQGKQIFVLTSRSEPEVRHMLQPDHQLARRVNGFFHADNISHLKPDPRAFDAMLATTTLSPDECVYVGDSPGDAEAAAGAGIRFVASLESGIRSRDDFAPYPVDAFVPAFADLGRAVSRLDERAPRM